MKKRLRISNGVYFMEFEDNESGLFRAKHFRAVYSNLFFRRRIKSILQFEAEKVPLGKVLEHDTGKNIENPLAL